MANGQSSKTGSDTVNSRQAVDSLVLATVNAPYRRDITAESLAACLGTTQLDEWLAHIANFFTDVSPNLVLAFAEFHGISATRPAQTYFAVKSKTGECNPDLESALASLAPAA